MQEISVVGKVAGLEILCIHRCSNIIELPAEIGRLKCLRLLDLDACEERVAAGVVSSLVGLEELKIFNCFHEWEAKGSQTEESNASQSELESLPNLSSLKIETSDCSLVAEEICLS